MLYDHLQQRYGTHLAKRVQRELNGKEFAQVPVDQVSEFLAARADKAAQDYKSLMDNPLERGNVRSEVLQKRWQDAEDLAYIVTIADDVTLTVRASMNSGR